MKNPLSTTEETARPGLWAEAWKPSVSEGEELTLKVIIGQALGTASMCWKPKPEGIFDSEKAEWVLGGAINEIEKLQFRHGPLDQAPEIYKDTYADLCDQSEPCIGEASEPQQTEEDRLRWQQRTADKAEIIELILSYRNVADDETKLRQIKVVMD